jgi:cyclopropane-fatty-acyl-phospholipid synthase
MLRALAAAFKDCGTACGRMTKDINRKTLAPLVDAAKRMVLELLRKADVQVDGSRPWDIRVHDERFYRRTLSQGTLGLGEAYMDDWWDCERLDSFFEKVTRADLARALPLTLRNAAAYLHSRVFDAARRSRSPKVAKEHYDLGNDFYAGILSSRMQYTCAYWKGQKTLDAAQEQKLDLICRKLELKRGERVLELGCGWGGFAKFAAERYGCHVTAYNISQEQVRYARELCRGLPVNIVLADYRDAKGRFDKVASIGLCEHVGHKNYRKLMQVVDRCLKEDGLFLLHTIGSNVSDTKTDAWIAKYIFPVGMVPSMRQLTAASEGIFVMEDWHNFGPDYDKTLMAWHANFERSWPEFRTRYGDRFYRMWRYYLLSCAGAFRSRRLQLWQAVFSKPGGVARYESRR